MRHAIARQYRALGLAGAIVLGACGKSDDTLASDTALSRDVELARQGDPSQPKLNDAPNSPAARPAPAASAGNRPATAAGGRTGTVSAGTTLTFASTGLVCTNTNAVGSQVAATLSAPLTATNGVVIPAGSTVNLEVTGAKRSENMNDKAVLTLAVRSITVGGKTYTVDANLVSAETVDGDRSGKDAQKVVGGAAVGAIAGQILGGNTKSTVIGGAVGAAAGTAVAAATANHDLCIPQNGKITATLNVPLTVAAS